jgi:type II secretory pathway pseudopilin PulG
MISGRFAERFRSSDAGLGLVEIVVAMFMLGILAISLAPLLIQGMQASVRNTTVAAGTQLASERVQVAKAASPVCADVLATAGVTSITDARGVGLEATTVAGSCPGGTGVGTVSIEVTVVRTDTDETVASVATFVFVRP